MSLNIPFRDISAGRHKFDYERPLWLTSPQDVGYMWAIWRLRVCTDEHQPEVLVWKLNCTLVNEREISLHVHKAVTKYVRTSQERRNHQHHHHHHHLRRAQQQQQPRSCQSNKFTTRQQNKRHVDVKSKNNYVQNGKSSVQTTLNGALKWKQSSFPISLVCCRRNVPS